MVSRLTALILGICVVALSLGACGKDDGRAKLSPAEQIASIGDSLAEAETLEFSLVTEAIPDGIQGLLSAKGVGNREPAFKGTVELVTGGVKLPAEIVARDGIVWAKTGLNPRFVEVDPADLAAPDPSDLVGTAQDGLVRIFKEAENLEADGRSREGNLVLNNIKGTLPGSLFAELLPSAQGKNPYDVVYRVTDAGKLHDVRATGEFYKGHVLTYRLKMAPGPDSVTVERPVD